MIAAASDAGDSDFGNYDPTEVPLTASNVWHPSFVSAIPPAPIPATDEGRLRLQRLKAAICKRQSSGTTPRSTQGAFKTRTSWADTPTAFKRLLARSAGLDLTVVDKLDRDLTEGEKAAIRNAAGRLLKLAESVFAL